MKAIPVYILLTLLPFISNTQTANFELFTTKDGLKGFSTSHVTQDNRGYIWFINDNKIHRFDGRNFVQFSSPTDWDIGNAKINGLRSYQDSLLFILYENSAFIFNPGRGSWRPFRPLAEPPDNFTFSKILEQDGLIVQASDSLHQKQYWRIRKEQLEPLELATLTDSSHQLVRFDALNNAWIFNRGGITKTGQGGGRTTEVDWPAFCGNCHPIDMKFGPGEEITLLAGNKFFLFNKSTQQLRPHTINRFLQSERISFDRFIIEPNGNIWASGRFGINLIHYDAEKDLFHDFHEALKEILPIVFYFDGIENVFLDKTGTLWAESDVGLLKITMPVFSFDTYFKTGNRQLVNPSLTVGEQGLVYLVFKSGSALIDPGQKQGYGPFLLEDLTVGLYSPEDTIWQWDGRYLDGASAQLVDVKGSIDYRDHRQFVSLFAREKNRQMWWLFNNILYRLEKKDAELQWSLETRLSVQDEVFDVYMLHSGQQSGQLWIGCREQLLAYSPISKKLSTYNSQDLGFSFDVINVIEEDAKGNLWLGTDVGLIQYSPSDGVLGHYSVAEGLPNNFILGLLPEGDSCLWISTSYGLSRLSIITILRIFITVIRWTVTRMPGLLLQGSTSPDSAVSQAVVIPSG